MNETRCGLVARMLVAGAVSLAAIPVAASSGAELMPKGFDKVMTQAKAALEQLGESQTTMKSTLEACRTLGDGSSKASTDTLKDSIKESRDQFDELEKSVRQMEDDSTRYFNQWERSVLDLDGVDRTEADDMRAEYWDLFHEISDDAEQSQNELGALLDDLEKLVGTLEHEPSDPPSSHETALAEMTKKAEGWISDVDQRQKDAKATIQELTAR